MRVPPVIFLNTSLYGKTQAQISWVLRELLNEDVVERLIRHEAQPSALSGLETTSEFNNSPLYR